MAGDLDGLDQMKMIFAASAEKKRFLLKIIKAAVFVNATQFLILTIQIPAYLLEKFVLQKKFSTRVHAKSVLLEKFLQKIAEAALFAEGIKTCMYQMSWKYCHHDTEIAANGRCVYCQIGTVPNPEATKCIKSREYSKHHFQRTVHLI